MKMTAKSLASFRYLSEWEQHLAFCAVASFLPEFLEKFNVDWKTAAGHSAGSNIPLYWICQETHIFSFDNAQIYARHTAEAQATAQ